MLWSTYDMDTCREHHIEKRYVGDLLVQVRRRTTWQTTYDPDNGWWSGLHVESYFVWYGIVELRIWDLQESFGRQRDQSCLCEKLDQILRDDSLRCSDEILFFVSRLSRSWANSQIVHRREKLQRFHFDHDISCEIQLLELASLNSVGHPVLSSSCCPPFSLSIVSPDNCLTARPTVILTVIVLWSDHHQRLKKKSRSVTRPRMVAELVVTTTEPGSLREYCGTSLGSDARTYVEFATAGSASGSAARSDRTWAGTPDARTNDDRCGESSTNSS